MTRDMDTVKMSYEEMIDTLKGLVFGTFDRTTVKERDALDMAIKALQAESCGDAVSRKDLERLKRWRLPYDTNTTIPKSDLFVKLTDIRALPPVKPVACIAKVNFSKGDMQEIVDDKVEELRTEKHTDRQIYDGCILLMQKDG